MGPGRALTVPLIWRRMHDECSSGPPGSDLWCSHHTAEGLWSD